MDSTLFYAFLFISFCLNVVLLIRLQQLQQNLNKIKGGVKLSRDELELLKSRLKKLKDLS